MIKSLWKRICICLLVFCLILTIFPSYALAEEAGTSELSDSDNISMVVDVYDGVPGTANLSPITTLNPAGSEIKTDIGGWAYTDTRYLNIQLSNVPKDKQYELVITMQPIIEVKNIPTVGGTTYTYTKNTMSVNDGGNYAVNDYSGTIVYTLNEGVTNVGFPLSLGYDINLWNTFVGELNNYEDVPLLSVGLRQVGNTTVEQQYDLYNAQATVAWDESMSIRINSATSVTLAKEDVSTITLHRMVNSGYGGSFYYPKLVLEIQAPSYTHTDGETYYLKPDISEAGANATSGQADCTVEYNEDTHTLTMTLLNFYTTNTSHFKGIKFQLPEDVAEIISAPTSRAFKGKMTVTEYRSPQATTGGIQWNINSSNGAFTINYNTQENSQLAVYRTGTSTVSGAFSDIVKCLGVLSLENKGTGSSKPVRVKLDFDSTNTNAIHVTTINIMPDFVSETIEVKYTMVDKDGNLVVTNGSFTLDNTYRGADPSAFTGTKLNNNNRRITLKREDLPENHSQYYFKSIEYTIASVPPQMKMYYGNGAKSVSGAGSFWGYVDKKHGTKAVVQATFSEISYVDEQEVLTPLFTPATTTATVKIDEAPTSNYYVKDAAFVDTKGNVVTTIQAGDDFILSGGVAVTAYPYSTCGVLENVRIGLKLPQGITFTAEDVVVSVGTAIPTENIRVHPPTDEIPIWIVEFLEEELTLGYYKENLTKLTDGDCIDFSITLHTERTMPEHDLMTYTTIWAAGEGQTNILTGAYGYYVATDVYDLNGNGSTTDNIASSSSQKIKELTIEAAPALLDITGSVRGFKETVGDSDASLEHFADCVTYDLKIACTDGGSTKDFCYYIPIPKTNFEQENNFVNQGEVDLDLREKPTITKTGGANFEIMYTTHTISEKWTYEYVNTTSEIAWTTVSEAPEGFDWNSVTMLKVVPTETVIETGTLSVISVPLEYSGDNYQYADAAEKFAYDAGKVIQFSSRGYYYHSKGVQNFAGDVSTTLSTIRLEYTIPEVQKITLTAAKEGTELKGEDTSTASITISTKFGLFQEYEIRLVKPSNITLVPSDTKFDNLNCNTNFGIGVSLTTDTKNYAAKDIHENASVNNPIKLGRAESEESATFTFTIYNGDALSDTTTPKTVYLDIIGENGVTIPVEITINVIAAPVEDATVAIIDRKEYVPFSGTTSVQISQDSAITAQFVAGGVVPNNYPERILSFNQAPSMGTTILMIDWTDNTKPEFYHYTFDNATTTQIPLTEFVRLSDGNDYVNPEGIASIPKETLLFVVDFPDATEESSAITLTRKAATASGIENLVDTLYYQVSGERSFSVTVPTENVELNTSFDLGYINTAPTNTDNYYSNRKMAFVISADKQSSQVSMPADAKLVVDDVVYTQNNKGQFIVPLGNISNTGTSQQTKSMVLQTVGLTGDCILNVELWVSATASDSAPIAGEKLLTKQFTITPMKMPSLRVVTISNRKFVLGQDELSAEVLCEGLKLEDCFVYLQVQQKKSNSGYAADNYYLSTLNGIQASMKNDVTRSVTSGSTMKLVFQDSLTPGTYRLLFTVEKEEVVLSVPYNFVVVE